MSSESPLNDAICAFPYSSLTIRGNGDVVTCDPSLRPLGSMANNNLKEIWEGSELAAVRNSFQQRSVPLQCHGCFKSRSMGYWTKRDVYNNQYCDKNNINPQPNTHALYNHLTKTPPKLNHLDISFSKTCNLDCVMCSSEYSSSWISHDKIFFEGKSKYRDEVRSFVKPTPPHKTIVNDSLEVADDLQMIKIKGGEPLLDTSCFAFLEKLPRTNFSGGVYIVTNGTHVSPKILRILDKVPNLKLVVSIDGTGEIYEWIRKFSFLQIERNLHSFLELDSLQAIEIAFTTSAYNVMNLLDFMRWDESMRVNPKFSGAMFSQRAYQKYMRAAIVPIDHRLEVRRSIDKYFSHHYLQEDITNLLVALEQDAPEHEHIDNFLHWTNYCNTIRDTDIFSLVPELQEVKNSRPPQPSNSDYQHSINPAP